MNQNQMNILVVYSANYFPFGIVAGMEYLGCSVVTVPEEVDLNEKFLDGYSPDMLVVTQEVKWSIANAVVSLARTRAKPEINLKTVLLSNILSISDQQGFVLAGFDAVLAIPNSIGQLRAYLDCVPRDMLEMRMLNGGIFDVVDFRGRCRDKTQLMIRALEAFQVEVGRHIKQIAPNYDASKELSHSRYLHGLLGLLLEVGAVDAAATVRRIQDTFDRSQGLSPTELVKIKDLLEWAALKAGMLVCELRLRN